MLFRINKQSPDIVPEAESGFEMTKTWGMTPRPIVVDTWFWGLADGMQVVVQQRGRGGR